MRTPITRTAVTTLTAVLRHLEHCVVEGFCKPLVGIAEPYTWDGVRELVLSGRLSAESVVAVDVPADDDVIHDVQDVDLADVSHI
jgi:hypothetical protein